MTDLLRSAVRYQWQWIHTYLPPPSPQSNEIYSHLVLFLFGGKSSPLMTLDPIERSSLMKIRVWLRLQRGYCVNMQTLEGKLYKICFKYTHTRALISHLNFYSIVSFTPLCCIITLMEGTVGRRFIYGRGMKKERKQQSHNPPRDEEFSVGKR